MRKLLVSLLVVLFLVVAAPWFCGMQLKEGGDQFLAKALSENSTSGVTAELKDYHRGIWRSSATLVVTITDPSGGQTRPRMPFSLQKVSFSLDEQFRHGPIFFDGEKLRFGWGGILTKPVISPQVQAAIDMIFANQTQKPEISGVSVANFNGGLENTISMPAFSYADKMQQGQFKWKGLTVNVNYNKSFTQAQGLIDFPGVNANFMQTDIKVDDTKITFNLYSAPPTVKKFWLGKMNFSMNEFSVHAPTQNFVLSGLDYSTDSKRDKELMDIQAGFKLNKLMVNDQSYGPSEADLSLNKLDLVAMSTLVTELQKHPISGMQNDSSDELIAVLPSVVRVFNKGTEYSLKKLTIQTPKGLITGDFSLAFIPGSDVIKTMDDATKLLNRLKGTINLELPVILLKDINDSMVLQQVKSQQQAAMNQQRTTGNDTSTEPVVPMTDEQLTQKATQQSTQQIQLWIQQGILKQEGELYKLHLTLQDGVANLNGKSFGTIESLMQIKVK